MSVDRPNYLEIELPERKDEQVSFWNGDTQYWIKADQDYAWALLVIGADRKGHRILEFSKREDGFHESDDRIGLHAKAVDDWRALVRREIR